MAHDRVREIISSVENATAGSDLSRATSPGGDWHEANGSANGVRAEDDGRIRPRTYPYEKYLPYPSESNEVKRRNIAEFIEELYIAVAAGDFAVGVQHWTREIRGWLQLKFDITRSQRSSLVKLYYELALAPGLDLSLSERFASTFMALIK